MVYYLLNDLRSSILLLAALINFFLNNFYLLPLIFI